MIAGPTNRRGSETYALQTMAVGADFEVHYIRGFRRRPLADTAKVSVHRAQDADVLTLGPNAGRVAVIILDRDATGYDRCAITSAGKGVAGVRGDLGVCALFAPAVVRETVPGTVVRSLEKVIGKPVGAKRVPLPKAAPRWRLRRRRRSRSGTCRGAGLQ